MEIERRVEIIRLQIDSQEKIREQFQKEGNQVGVKRADKQIKKLKAELRRWM
jgi:hypothetical protein